MSDVSNGIPRASQGRWLGAESQHWMTFSEACDLARRVLGVEDDPGGNYGTSAVIARANDGLIGIGAHRTERMIEHPGQRPVCRIFDQFDGAAFMELLFANYHSLPGESGGNADEHSWGPAYLNLPAGDFKFEITNNEPAFRITYSVWALMLNRDDVETWFPLSSQPQQIIPISTSGKGRPPAGWWPAFSEELATFIHDTGPPEGQGADGQSTVIDAICERLAARGKAEPSRSTIQPVISSVLRRLRGEDA